MATSLEPRTRSSRPYVDFDEYVDFQLAKTRTGIRWNDIVTAGMTIAAFAVAYLLLFAVLDHWIVPGGFGETARLVLASTLAVACGVWLVFKIVVPYLRRVSALYAARAIETAEPGLKSTLLNLVDLKRSGRPIPDEIRTTLEKRAARTLSQTDVDRAVDRRALMRVSYVLLALVVLTCLYAVLSPKKISFARAFVPSAPVAPATRTRIADIRTEPDFTAFRENELLWRTELEVTVDLQGEEPEDVTLFYTTEDRKFVDEPVVMHQVEEGLKQYRGVLNGHNGRGILQDMTWRIEAGDAVSDRYTVKVIQPPSVDIDEIRYRYPEYMELEPTTEVGSHIDAWEGTTVTLTATVNKPVQSAVLQFFDTQDTSVRGEERRMQIVGRRRLKAEWTLGFRTDGTAPRHYRIRVTTEDGETDPNPTLHDLTIRPDRAPLVELLDPRTDLKVPANAVVPLFFEARDPDFKLRYVTLRAKKNGEVLPRSPQLFEGLQQQYRGTWEWELEPLDLKPGDVLTYWLEARDNKQPLGNLSQRRQVLELHIVEAVSEEEADRQLKVGRDRIRDKMQEDDQDDNGRRQPERRPQEPADDQRPAGEGQQPENEQQQQAEGEGESKQPAEEGGNQPSGDENTGDEKEGTENGETGSGREEKLDPNGAEDLEALKRLLEQQQQQEKQPEQNGSDQQPPEKTDNRQDDGSKQSGEEKQPQDDGAEESPTKNGQDRPQPQDGSPQDDPSGAGGEGDGQQSEGGPDKGTSQGTPDADQESSANAKSGGDGEKPGQGAKPKDQAEQVKDGTETPAEESPDAERRKASGDEQGPASAADDPNAKSTPAKNELERKEGDKPTTRPGKNDTDVKPQERNSGNPGSTNPDKAQPAPRTKKDQTDGDTPDPTRSTPQENDPNRPAADQDQQPDAANEENRGKGLPEGQTSEKPQGGESGNGKPNDQGNKGSNKPGAGDATGNPGGQEQSDGTKSGQTDGQKGAGSAEQPAQQDGGKPKSAGGEDGSGSKPGAGQQRPAGQSDQTGKQPGEPAGGKAAGGARTDQPKVGGGHARGGPSAGPPGEGTGSAPIPEAEEANLEYNKKATNLVLKKLQQDLEEGELDPELLEEFGWTEEDFRNFAERMRNRLDQQDDSLPPTEQVHRKQLEEFLKGFNLRRGTSARDRSSPNVAPRRRPVPPEFRDAYEAYTRSLSRRGERDAE